MRKIILLLAAITFANNISGQTRIITDKKCWIDFQIVQHIGLNNWSNADFVNDGLPGTNITELRGVFNLYFGSSNVVGLFADMGVGIMSAPRMRTFDADRMPMPHSGTQYHVREIVSESGNSSASAHLKMIFGLFGRISVNKKLSIMPYAGAGFLTMPQRRYDVILKEEGSNTQYEALYLWNSLNGNNYETPIALGCLNGRVNFSYRLSHRSNLLLGIEYTWFLNTLDFHSRFTNSFNANVWKDYRVKGNRMNMLGLSAGISFR